MFDEQADFGLVVDAFHVDLGGDQLVVLLLPSLLLVLPVALLDVGHDSAEIAFLFLYSLGNHVVLIKTNRRWQILSLDPTSAEVHLVGGAQIRRNLPAEEFFEGPQVELFVFVSALLRYNVLQDPLGYLDDLLGGRQHWERVF